MNKLKHDKGECTYIAHQKFTTKWASEGAGSELVPKLIKQTNMTH